MFGGLETGIGLEVVRWFQTIRFGLFDNLALFFHAANSGLFYVVFIGAIYWMFDKRLGMRMLFALIIIGLVTLVFKDIFARPRPYEILNGGIIPLVNEHGYGIPSGHSSMPLVIWGYCAYWLKRRPITIGVMIFVTLMGLSRMYLGVHFPQDVIGGWLLGGVVLWLYVNFVEQVVPWWEKQGLLIQLGLPSAIGILSMLFFIDDVDGLTFIGLLIGAGIAVVVESRYVHFTHTENLMRRAAQFIIGIIISVAILQGLDVAFEVIEPPTYVYAEDNTEGIMALQAQVVAADESATLVCTYAQENDLDEAMINVCEEQVTPLAALLRVLRYSLLVVVAMSFVPYLSIKGKLMEREGDSKSSI
jgi:membrane-associated phospholipid phosphatase